MTELGPLHYRNAELVDAIIEQVYEADQPVPWDQVVADHTTDEHPWRTVENTMYDLVAFGVLHRVGRPGARGRRDTRALKPTLLGHAWLEQRVLPLLRDDQAADP